MDPGFFRVQLCVTPEFSRDESLSLHCVFVHTGSFPVAALLTDKQPSVSARCRHSVCTYFLVELEYRSAIRNTNSDFTLLPIG